MKEEKEYRDNRGNVVLLTVIAIVTMVIVLVGATFAYLASNIQGSESANINATTNAGSDLLLITPGADLTLTANEENFGIDDEDLSVDSVASILFQTTNTSSEGVTKQYEVVLEVLSNNFEYTSGKCFVKPTGTGAVIGGITKKENCTGNNKWATTNGTDYECYDGTATTFTRVTGASYAHQLGCLSRNANMWAPEEVAELVIDLYRDSDNASYTNQTSCESSGKCVNNKREIESSYNSAALCEANDGIWLSNIWDTEENACFELVAAKDITTVKNETEVGLYSPVTINARKTVNNGTTTHLYKPIVTLRNFDHNQIMNGKKAFSAALTFRLITEP